MACKVGRARRARRLDAAVPASFAKASAANNASPPKLQRRRTVPPSNCVSAVFKSDAKVPERPLFASSPPLGRARAAVWAARLGIGEPQFSPVDASVRAQFALFLEN
jgi:hypothetical protein